VLYTCKKKAKKQFTSIYHRSKEKSFFRFALQNPEDEGTFPKCGSLKKMYGPGKFVAVSGREAAVKGAKRLKCSRRE
jgi:hypothetical protein